MLLSQTLPEGSYKKNTLDLPHAQQLIGNSMEKSHYHIGEVEFNVQDKNLVFNRYRSVKLTNRETLILQYLLECPNQAITLTEIIQKGLVQHPSDPIATRK
ncbi:MAG: DNA-binding response OmpR family regulator, partial [Alteromonadaceae bacterium]